MIGDEPIVRRAYSKYFDLRARPQHILENSLCAPTMEPTRDEQHRSNSGPFLQKVRHEPRFRNGADNPIANYFDSVLGNPFPKQDGSAYLLLTRVRNAKRIQLARCFSRSGREIQILGMNPW